MRNFTSIDPVEQLIQAWDRDPTIAENISHREIQEAQPGRYTSLPGDMHPKLIAALRHRGIESLYLHQSTAWNLAREGRNVVVATGTASGKTYCYHLPILQTCLSSPVARALCLYPTKALAQDQLKQLKGLEEYLNDELTATRLTSNIYDGDTPASHRSEIRKKSNVILTNPDMLHLSILPHHTIWVDFFKNLKYVVIDEAHIYRGVFGSHLANIIRRLKRITQFYASMPQFILTSATIANPVDLAEKLIEEPAELVNLDGAPKGKRYFFFINPPVVNPEMGIRKGASSEAIHLSKDLLASQIQTIIFTRSRRSVELLLRNLREQLPARANIRGYRSGYLPRERRQIEQDLRSGEAEVVVATNALELGIDIGNLDASLLVGYPGSVAATRQQAGRAGRRNAPALSVFIASADPLDQYLIKNPSYILGKSPEHALIDPNHLLILIQHLRCAAFELPFTLGSGFGSVPPEFAQELLDLLQNSGELHLSNLKYYWTAAQYPANEVSLRTSTPNKVRLLTGDSNNLVSIGDVDLPSSYWLTHPGAIYLHQGASYEVIDLDLNQNCALLKPVETDFYTEAVRKTSVEKLTLHQNESAAAFDKSFGDVLVSSQTVGFKRIQWSNNQVIDQEPLDLPVYELRTMGYWISLSEATLTMLREQGLWLNDPIDYGKDWQRLRRLARQRDAFTCQLCGRMEIGEEHHVHHKIPFRTFFNPQEANQLDNLVTLCSSCHRKAEEAVRMRSGLAGLAYLLYHLAPLYVMCDITDIGVDSDPQSSLAEGKPAVCIYDQIPAGIGLSKKMFELQDQILEDAFHLIESCPCSEGCPSCIGPGGENGYGGKKETRAILTVLTGRDL